MSVPAPAPPVKKRKTTAEASAESYVKLTEKELSDLYNQSSASTAKKLRDAGDLFQKANTKSPVWKYYKWCKIEGKMGVVCIKCGLRTAFNQTSNMGSHLYEGHSMAEFQPAQVRSGQQTLDKWGDDVFRSEREKAVVYFLIKDMRPLRTVQTDAFKDMCWELTKHDKEFTIPDPHTLSLRILTEHEYLKAVVCALILSSSKLTHAMCVGQGASEISNCLSHNTGRVVST
jgi:hypothetical protein